MGSNKPGPKPLRVKVGTEWEDAMKKALTTKPPKTTQKKPTDK